MTRLYLVRHGTHDLLGKVLAGRRPGIALSAAGRAQADGLAAFFAQQPDVAAVVSSPLERCRETAGPIAARRGLAVVENEALLELDCGDWTGCPFDRLAADPRWRRWNSDRSRAVVPGGEAAEAVRVRVMSFVESQAVPDRAPVVAVTHGDVIKTVVLTLLGASLDAHDRVEIDPASVTTVDLWAGGGKVVSLNRGSREDRPLRLDPPQPRRSPEIRRTARVTGRAGLTRDTIAERVRALGPWFHNMDLGGVRTAPDHFLWDYPGVKFRRFAAALPADLTGKSVLDIGCNGGFYAIEMKRRGAARVLGIDADERYLAQARFAAEVTEQEIEFRRLSVYDLGTLGERFDLVMFMGVLYHLRHPLLALDIIHDTVARDLLLFQSMQRGSAAVEPVAEDYDFFESDHFDRPGYPKLHFIEHRYSRDPTNWWAPNAACSAAMLRSAGFAILDQPEDEVFLCRRVEVVAPGAVYPRKDPPS